MDFLTFIILYLAVIGVHVLEEWTKSKVKIKELELEIIKEKNRGIK